LNKITQKSATQRIRTNHKATPSFFDQNFLHQIFNSLAPTAAVDRKNKAGSRVKEGNRGGIWLTISVSKNKKAKHA
jgi:hypothetical protein